MAEFLPWMIKESLGKILWKKMWRNYECLKKSLAAILLKLLEMILKKHGGFFEAIIIWFFERVFCGICGKKMQCKFWWNFNQIFSQIFERIPEDNLRMNSFEIFLIIREVHEFLKKIPQKFSEDSNLENIKKIFTYRAA